MRPHLAHIQNTMIKKRLADDAADVAKSLAKYRKLVADARGHGYNDQEIIGELEGERERIKRDIRCGDSLYMKGVENAQNSCIDSIDKIISELKGEDHGLVHKLS